MKVRRKMQARRWRSSSVMSGKAVVVAAVGGVKSVA